jgi:hypothetical protein
MEEEDAIQVQEAPPQDNVSKIYSYLKQQKVVVPENEEDFRKSLSDKKNSDKVYSYLKQRDVKVQDTPDEFYSSLTTPKKKESTEGEESVSSSGSGVPGEPSGKSGGSIQLTDEQKKKLGESVKEKTPQELNYEEIQKRDKIRKEEEYLESREQLKRELTSHDDPVISFFKTIYSGLVDQVPKEYYTQRLRMSKGSFGDIYDKRSDLNAFGGNKFLEQLPKGTSIEEFHEWSRNQPGTIRGQSYDTRAKLFLTEKLGAEGFEKLKNQFKETNVEERVGYEKEIAQQGKEASEKLSGTVQSLENVHGAVDFLNFAGNMVGQAAYRAPVSIVSGPVGSIIAESAAVYDRQIDLLAEKHNISREEVIRRGLDKPAEGQALAVLAGTLDSASEFNLLGLFRNAAGKQLKSGAIKQFTEGFIKGGAPEAITETAQGEMEEYAASKGAGVEYSPDAWRMATAGVGGLIGSGPIGGITNVRSIEREIKAPKGDLGVSEKPPTKEVIEAVATKEKSTPTQPLTPAQKVAPSKEVVQQQIESTPVESVQSLDQSAEVIQEKVESNEATQGEQIGGTEPGISEVTQPEVTPEEVIQEEAPTAQEEETIIPEDIHKAAEKAFIDYESEYFMEKSKELTGKEHLDDMNPDELSTMLDYIQQRNDSQNQQQPVPGQVGERQEPVETEPVEEGGGEATETSGVLQKPKEVGERATVKKISESENIAPKARNAVKDFAEYEKKRQKISQEKAVDWIDEKGEDEAIKSISTKWGTKSLSNLEENAVRSELLDRLNKQMISADKKGDTKVANAAFDKFMKVSKNFAENITDQAQALSFLGTLEGMLGSKEGAIRFATREIEGSRKNVIRNQQPIIEKAKSIVSELSNTNREELLKHPEVHKLIKEVRETVEASRKVSKENTVKIFGKSKDQAIADRRKASTELGKLLGGSAKTGIDPKAIKLLAEVAYNKVIESGITLIEFISEVHSQYGGRFTQDQIEEAWNMKAKDADDKIANQPKKEKKEIKEQFVENLIKEKKEKTDEQKDRDKERKELKKSFDKRVLDAIAEFSSGDGDAFNKLSDALIKEFNVKPDQAKKFKESIESIAKDKQKAIKDKLIKKYIPSGKKKNAKEKKQYYEKIIDLHNSGLLTDADFEDQVATAMGMPTMTKEIADQIGEYVDKIKKAPEGKFKNIAITNMLDFVAKQKGFSKSDYLTASYKAGLFSGIDTQVINNISNGFSSMAYILESVATNPMEGIQMLKSITNPTSFSRGLSEAGDLLTTGIDPRQVQDSKMRVLEHSPRSFWGFGKPLKGAKQILDPSLEQQKKYAFRGLAAGDIIATTPLSEMAQTATFRRFAVKNGLRGTQIDTYIQEQMGLTEEKQAIAKAQAEQEYEDGLLPQDEKKKKSIIKSRQREIIEQSRNPEVVQRAKDFSQRQLFTSPPTGYSGLVAKNLNNLIRDIPLLNAFIPVINIAGNITQRGIEYTPPFAIFRGVTHYVSNKVQGVDFSTSLREDWEKLKSGDPEMEQRLKRFTAGMIITAATLMLFHESEDDEENLISKLTGHEIKLHGGGPGSLRNMKPTYQKQETGWKPYSLQIDGTYIRYDLVPGYNVLLSTMGEYYDAVRYKKLSKKDSIERYGWALTNSANVILKSSFLQSVTGFLDGLFSGDFKKIERTFVVNPVMAFAFPKFQKNLFNLFDDKIYSNNDYKETITRSIPILNGYTNEPILNPLGEPVIKNWWDRVELFSKKKEGAVIYNQMADKKYNIPSPSMANLCESLKRDIDSKTFNQFYIYRGKEIIELFNQYGEELAGIEDKEEYEKTVDDLMEKAANNAKYRIGEDNNWEDVMNRFEYEDINLPYYERDENGDLKKTKY